MRILHSLVAYYLNFRCREFRTPIRPNFRIDWRIPSLRKLCGEKLECEKVKIKYELRGNKRGNNQY
jgi:hypothetical protein